MRNVTSMVIVLVATTTCVALTTTSAGQEYTQGQDDMKKLKHELKQLDAEPKKGDEVIALRDVELKVETETVGTVRKGEKLTVEDVQAEWLWVQSGDARGWIESTSVIGTAGRPTPRQKEDRSGFRARLEGKRVAIYNLVGNVKVVRGEGSAVIVEVRRGGRDAARLRVATGNVGGRETLRVIYPAHVIVPSPPFGSVHTTVYVRDDGTFDGSRSSGRAVVISNVRQLAGAVPRGPRLEACANLTVHVPAQRDVSVHVAVGKLCARDVQADLTLHNLMGDVETSGTRGALLDIDAGQGNVRLSKVTASNFHVKAGQGNVEVDTASDVKQFDIDAGQGNVRLSKVTASNLKVKAAQGDVEIDLTSDVDGLTINAGQGDVTLRVPNELGAEVVLDTQLGNVDVQVPITTSIRREDKVRGTMGDGHGSIKISAGMGEIRLLRRDAGPLVPQQAGGPHE